VVVAIALAIALTMRRSRAMRETAAAPR